MIIKNFRIEVTEEENGLYSYHIKDLDSHKTLTAETGFRSQKEALNEAIRVSGFWV